MQQTLGSFFESSSLKNDFFEFVLKTLVMKKKPMPLVTIFIFHKNVAKLSGNKFYFQVIGFEVEDKRLGMWEKSSRQ
jgi:hypothetical protein